MRIPLTAAATAALLVGLTTSPAGAQGGHSLALTGPTAAGKDRAITLQASGVVPSDVFLNRYLNVYALPASVVSACPSTYQGALQIKDNTTSQGGETVALAVPVEGRFSTPVAWTPRFPGRFLLCGYVHDLVETWATATHAVATGAAGGGAKPKPLQAPRVTRSGRTLICSPGRWSQAPARYAYHWRVDGKRLAGVNSRTLRITRALTDRSVRCGVTAANAAGRTTALSNPLRVR